jgi:hypothetical protein
MAILRICQGESAPWQCPSGRSHLGGRHQVLWEVLPGAGPGWECLSAGQQRPTGAGSQVGTGGSDGCGTVCRAHSRSVGDVPVATCAKTSGGWTGDVGAASPAADGVDSLTALTSAAWGCGDGLVWRPSPGAQAPGSDAKPSGLGVQPGRGFAREPGAEHAGWPRHRPRHQASAYGCLAACRWYRKCMLTGKKDPNSQFL